MVLTVKDGIKDAAHNSNTDKPEIVNSLIEGFVEKKLSTEV